MLEKRRTERCLPSRRIARITAVLVALCMSIGIVLARPVDPPHRYNPRSLDGALVSLTNLTDGRTWSAWAYRDGAEYDVAISSRDAGGYWSEPVFFGRNDNRNQVQPAMAVGASGNLYLAYTDRGTGAIMITALRTGSDTWLRPFAVTQDGERGQMPALRVVADRLIVAFQVGRALAIRDLPLFPQSTSVSGQGVQDGPDPINSSWDPDSGGGSGGGSGGSGGGGSQGGSSTGGVGPTTTTGGTGPGGD